MKELMLRRFNVVLVQKSNIKFENEVANLGKINLNESIEHIFYFSNISNAPSVIYNVEATCGCMGGKLTCSNITRRKRFHKCSFKRFVYWIF